MHFRLLLTVRGLRLNQHSVSPLEYEVKAQHRVLVQLRRATEAELADGHDRDNALCQSETEFEPNPRVQADFQSLARDRLPEDSLAREAWPWDNGSIDLEGNIPPNESVPLGILPERQQTAIRQISDELHNAARRAVALTRWRTADEGLHSPLAHRAAEWSVDGAAWRPLPGEMFVSVWEGRDVRIDEQRRQEIQALLDGGIDEPLAHTIYREAWAQRHENRRSAVLTGMTALEVGVKQHIAERFPDTAWLLGAVQAPPLHRMLTEYLQQLEGRRLDADRVEIVKQGVNLRNRIAHQPRDITIQYDTVEQILVCVRDILWWLDSLRGFEWAAGFQRQAPEPA